MTERRRVPQPIVDDPTFWDASLGDDAGFKRETGFWILTRADGCVIDPRASAASPSETPAGVPASEEVDSQKGPPEPLSFDVVRR